MCDMLFCTEYGCRWQITVCLYKKNYVHNMRMNCEKKGFSAYEKLLSTKSSN